MTRWNLARDQAITNVSSNGISEGAGSNASSLVRRRTDVTVQKEYILIRISMGSASSLLCRPLIILVKNREQLNVKVARKVFQL